MGLKHKLFSLHERIYSDDELIDVSNRVDNPTMLFHHQPVWEMDSLFGNEIIWSGFNGGTFTDNYVEKFNSKTKKDVIINFIKKNSLTLIVLI